MKNFVGILTGLCLISGMLTFTNRQLAHANLAVRAEMSDGQRLVWSSWYRSTPDIYGNQPIRLPRRVAETLLAAIETTVDSLHDHVESSGSPENELSVTMEDLCLLVALEDALRADLSFDVRDSEPLFAMAG